MSKMSIEGKCRPRFKGIENFLRRVAFNLGNTPSQTEVKIISCIPIDVTDLQHKIIQLEHEIEDRALHTAEHGPARTSVVQTALGTPRLTPTPAPAPAPAPSAPPPAPTRHDSDVYSSFRPNKQSVSFVFPSHNSEKCPSKPGASCQTPPPTNTECVPFIDNSCDCEQRGGLFRFQKPRKLLKKKDKVNTQLVYYAEASSASPFKDYAAEMSRTPKETMDRAYLADMVRKQYKPDKMVAEMSDTSQFSSPVCRDVQNREYEACQNASDVCSCCRGRFHDVDPPRHAYTVFDTNPTTSNDYTNSMFYDTSLYDMVPVRDRPTKQKNDDERPKKKEHKTNRNCPEKVRVKSRFQPYVVNYHNAAPVRVNHKLTRRKLPVKSYSKNVKRIASKRQLLPQTSTETSYSCSVNCGEIYPRAPYARPIVQRIIHPSPKAVLHKNAECLTISLNNTECQTASTKSVQLEAVVPDVDKTEITLNQIKSILQSVLTEVKTNSQLKNVAEEKLRKDAVVQKGQSQSDMQACSSLLHSYSYSTPYSMNPYAASYSRQMNPSQPLCYPGPYKCLQNYPLFIQTTGRQCACCYRNMSNVAKSAHTKHAITTATNTESTTLPENRNKETEKLIKEIYKSLAINMDFPAKDTSSSDYAMLRSSDNSKKRFDYNYEAGPSRPQRTDVTADCVVKKVQDTSTMPIYGNRTFESNIISNAASTRTPLASRTTTDNRTMAEKYAESQTRHSAYSGARGRRVQGAGRRGYMVELPNATTSISYSSSSSEPESDETVVPTDEPKKKEKTSLFSKVANLFKAKAKKSVKEESDSDQESEASDSDEYQTIDTRSEKRPVKHVTYEKHRPKVIPHSKVSYSRYYMNRDHKERRRSPYMEQEYRRYFDEKLMFHHGGHKYSSDQPLSNQSVLPQRTYPVYWQDYEARSVQVDPPRRSLTAEESPVDQTTVGHMVQTKASNKGLAWLKKHKLGIHCGEQWKKFILES